ncbi:hypothetical protein [Dysgonomonas macrotermitis]|uniref:Uncharacterized protein n=1 Tax=Dysgonomonas macrotermitis TaxID=1346286 RepID=A0A1M5HCG4_9BACT|nr:hypothetical protein [Dysgonomonas macrotermitis]SHG13655.1 hypothetical protein SAMN05444362_11623 [Dysgonomonas macrotermitis]
MKNRVLVVAVVITMAACKNDPNESTRTQSSPAETEIQIATDSVPQDTGAALQVIARHDLSPTDLYTDYDGGNQLQDYFVIELIDKATFLKNKQLAVSFISGDSTTFRKVNGELKLPCTNGSITFTDNISGNEKHKEFNFVGDVSTLNVYLLSGIYWEDWDYFFVDKQTGQTKQRFSNFPYLSVDQQFIVSIDIDSFEGAAYIDLYQVTDRRYIDPLIGMYVKSWIPVSSIDTIYWSKDNYLYIPVVNSRDYWEANGNYSGLDQYIRLKPVA